MNDQQIDAYCERWYMWCVTRRLYAPPSKLNILARLQPRKTPLRDPDGQLDADMSFFNMAIHGLCEDPAHAAEAACFLGLFWYAVNVKALAREMNCARGTIYNRARKFAAHAMTLSKTLRKIQDANSLPKCSSFSEHNSALVD
jgi:hypothetical protein